MPPTSDHHQHHHQQMPSSPVSGSPDSGPAPVPQPTTLPSNVSGGSGVATVGRGGGWPIGVGQSSWEAFFHSPASSATLQLTGYLRIYLACLVLFDQIMWGADRGWLLSPSHGVVPSTYQTELGWPKHQPSLFKLAPQSDRWFWAVHYGGIVCAFGLLLGVLPRLSLLGVFVTLLSFEASFHTVATDLQDDMLRIWTFYFFFLPLDTVTVYDALRWCSRQIRTTDGKEGTASSPSSTDSGKKQPEGDLHNDGAAAIGGCWTMWPYRLVQFQLWFIYFGTAWWKTLTSNSWTSGLELWKSMHGHVFCQSGLWQPNWMLNMLMPLKIIAWSTLLLEHVSLFTIWPLATRNYTVGVMALFHVGIDITMNMHIFEYASILGWLFFLARPAVPAIAVPDDAAPAEQNDADVPVGRQAEQPSSIKPIDSAGTTAAPAAAATVTSTANVGAKWTRRIVVNPLVVILLLVTWAQCNPAHLWEKAVESPPHTRGSGTHERMRSILRPAVLSYNKALLWVNSRASPWTLALGIWQSPWTIFSGAEGAAQGFRYFARIEYAVIGDEGDGLDDDTDENGTITDGSAPSIVWKTMIWASPDWSSMPWWQQKRYQRTMLFYENLASAERSIRKTFCRRLYEAHSSSGTADDTGAIVQPRIPGSIIKGQQEYVAQVASAAQQGKVVKITSILLRVRTHTGPSYPPNDLGNWDIPAVVPHPELDEEADVYLFTTEPNKVEDKECLRRNRQKHCRSTHAECRIMWEDCPQTCTEYFFVNRAFLLHPGTRVSDVEGQNRYTVLEELEDGRFSYKEEQTGELFEDDLYMNDFFLAEEVDDDYDLDMSSEGGLDDDLVVPPVRIDEL